MLVGSEAKRSHQRCFATSRIHRTRQSTFPEKDKRSLKSTESTVCYRIIDGSEVETGPTADRHRAVSCWLGGPRCYFGYNLSRNLRSKHGSSPSAKVRRWRRSSRCHCRPPTRCPSQIWLPPGHGMEYTPTSHKHLVPSALTSGGRHLFPRRVYAHRGPSVEVPVPQGRRTLSPSRPLWSGPPCAQMEEPTQERSYLEHETP